MGVVGAADPDCPGGSDLSAVMFSAVGAGDPAAEGVFFHRLGFSVLLRPAVHFQLYPVVGIGVDNRFMGVGSVVLGQLTVVDQSALAQVVLPVLGLQQKISGVGVISEDTGNGAFVPGVALLGKDALTVQPLHNGDDTLAIQKICINGADDFRFFWNHNILAFLVTVAQQKAPPGLSVLKVLTDTPLLIFAGGKALLLGIACQNGEHLYGAVDGIQITDKHCVVIDNNVLEEVE